MALLAQCGAGMHTAQQKCSRGADHAQQLRPTPPLLNSLQQTRPCHHPAASRQHPTVVCSASSTPAPNGSNSSAGRLPPQKSNAGVRTTPQPQSPAQLLHTVEFAAIAIAAVGQACLLVSTAVCQWRQTTQLADLQEQLHSIEATSTAAAAAGGGAQAHSTKQQASMQLQHPASLPAAAPAASTGLHLLTTSALVVGLLCGAGLRKLQIRHPYAQGSGGGGSLKPSADAAVRLAALEVASQQTAAQLTSAARQMDKLQARVRLATSDLKQPIRAVQGTTAQQSAALLKLSEQQVSLQKQVDGTQELIGALQGLAAKQFKVSAEALQQLKQGQAQLSSSTTKALSDMQRQQTALQQQIAAQHRELQALQQAAAQLQRQQQQQEAGSSWSGVDSGGSSSNSNGSVSGGTLPDPWRSAASTSAGHRGASSNDAQAGDAAGSSDSNSSSSSGENDRSGSSSHRPGTSAQASLNNGSHLPAAPSATP